MQDWQGIMMAGFLALGGFVFLRIVALARAHEVAQRQAEAESARRKAQRKEREQTRRDSRIVTAEPVRS